MITMKFNNNTSDSFSATDTTLAVMEKWVTARNSYYTEEAKRKRIPTDYKGVRLSQLSRVYWRATKTGRIYEYTVSKSWRQDGMCSTTHKIVPMHDTCNLRDRMNHDCSWDSWGNRSAMAWVVENGRKKPMGLGNVYGNRRTLNKIIDGWIDKGYKMFDSCYPFSACYLQHTAQRGYTWRGKTRNRLVRR